MQATTTTTAAARLKWYTFNIYYTDPFHGLDICVFHALGATQAQARATAISMVRKQYGLPADAINGTACVNMR